MTELENDFDLACPKCGNSGQIDVVEQIWTRLTKDGTRRNDNPDESLGQGDENKCKCGDCGHVATVADFRVEEEADDLPPDPEGQNDDRASWAEEAIQAFIITTGTAPEDAMCDLLCDMMHFADRNKKSYGEFEAALERAITHYVEETTATENDEGKE